MWVCPVIIVRLADIGMTVVLDYLPFSGHYLILIPPVAIASEIAGCVEYVPLVSNPKCWQTPTKAPHQPFLNYSLGARPVSPNVVLVHILPLVVFFFSHQASNICQAYPG